MTTFKAGEVIVEWRADLSRLKRDSKKAVDISKNAGKTAGIKYQSGFKTGTDGKELGATLQKNISKGFDAKQSGIKDGKSYNEGLKSQTKNTGSFAATKNASKLKTGLKIVGGKFGVLDDGLFGIGKSAFAVVVKQSLDAAKEIRNLSTVAGTSAKSFQELTFAADKYGVSQEKVSDILKDVNDKLGDFTQTGAGPFADFFENIAPKVGVLEKDFRGLSSDQALGLYVKTLEDANLSQDQMTFYLEAIASDATALLPIFRNNGKELNSMAAEADRLGIIMGDDLVADGAAAADKLDKLGKVIRGGVTRAIVEAAPEIEELTQELIELIPIAIKAAGAGIKIANAYAEAFGIIRDTVRNLGVGDKGARPLSNTLEGLEEDRKKLEKLKFAVQTELETGFLPGNKLAGLIFGNAAVENVGNDLFGVEAFDKARKNQILFAIEYQTVLNNIEAKKKSILGLEQESSKVESGKTSEANQGQTDGGNSNGSGASSGSDNLSNVGKKKAEAEAEKLSRKAQARENKEIAEFKRRSQIAQQALVERINAAKDLYDQSRTPQEQYMARLTELAAVEADVFLAQAAGGDATFSRARVQAVEELANATGDYEQAISKLIDLSSSSAISADDFGQGFQNLSNEVETAGLAIKRITELGNNGAISPEAVVAGVNAIKASVDYQRDLTAEKQKQIGQDVALVQAEIDKKQAALELAQLRQDIYGEEGVEVLQRELDILREQIDLLQNGVDPDDASNQATTIIENKELAQLQGQIRESFKGAFRAALDGNFESFLTNKLKNAAANMFDKALDNLLNVLVQNLASFIPGIGQFFAGGFATGGVIGTGKFGLVGEEGPEFISAGSGPLRITPLKQGLRGFNSSGLESQGTNHSPSSNVVMNISGIKDLRSFVKSQGTIEADMAAAIRRAQSDF